MRTRTSLLIIALASSALALPLFAHATGIPYFGPIVPTLASSCAAGWDSLIQMANNLIAFAITMAILFVAPIMIAYAGFLYVINPVKPEGRKEANTMLQNAIVGVVLALASWLIVDSVLTALTTTGGLSAWTSGMFGDGSAPCVSIQTETFNQSTGQTVTSGSSLLDCPGNLICSSGKCTEDSQLDQGDGSAGAACTQAKNNCQSPLLCDKTDVCSSPPDNTASTIPATCGVALSASGSGACDPAVASAGASAGGYTLGTNEAGMLACIAQYESTCGTKNLPYNLNYNWNGVKDSSNPSTAAGAYQVLLKKNTVCYDNSVCESAAGTPGVALNCKSAFDSKGFPITGTKLTQCETAAGNVACSAAAATCLLKSSGGSFKSAFLSAYAADPHAQSCASQYGG